MLHRPVEFTVSSGPSRLYHPNDRFRGFWTATLIDRLWIMLLPRIGLSVPLAKLVLPAYRWQIRRRLLRLYAELDRIDPLRTTIQDDEDLRARLEKLDRLDSDSAIEAVPKGYRDDVYKLRRDIDLIRRRLGAVDRVSDSEMPT